ncbi:MAG: hypothetical protein IKO73_09365 [Bacteroidaceae bacterium]|jgi:transcription antitermination factor NusG|nr:hypothetical protein [Bacteroidaceae bacterium]
MAKTKFSVGDKVKIVTSDLQPQFAGKVGEVKKVYRGFDEELVVYRISVGNEVLRGVAQDKDLEKC